MQWFYLSRHCKPVCELLLFRNFDLTEVLEYPFIFGEFWIKFAHALLQSYQTNQSVHYYCMQFFAMPSENEILLAKRISFIIIELPPVLYALFGELIPT